MRPARRSGFVALAMAFTATLVAAPQAETPDALAKRLQTRYDAIKDFTADFSQTYEGGVLRRKTTESGTLLIKKPGRMRWEY